MSVNIFRLRLMIDAQPLWKKGHPHQRTTGVAKTSWSQLRSWGETICCTDCPGIMSDMARRAIGTLSTTPTQNRRVMSTNSGLAASSKVTVRGSRAMPHMGQKPGAGRTISGCIGHTYSVLIEGAERAAGSSAIPHLGHGPGCVLRTSESMGQT